MGEHRRGREPIPAVPSPIRAIRGKFCCDMEKPPGAVCFPGAVEAMAVGLDQGLAAWTTAAKAWGSRTAKSASILRLRRMSAAFIA